MNIALVGNQNSGKTTLFNCLTGMNAKIGNWPGVTIERKTSKIKGTEHTITDLPGIYSLSPYSAEEDIARKYIFEEKPDVIINIVDATALERSLYLTTQLLELDANVIIALNMADMLEKKGIKIDIPKLEQKLHAKVVQISALKETGIKDLIIEIEKNIRLKRQEIFDSVIENGIKQIKDELSKQLTNRRFVAVKLLEKDERFEKLTTTKIENVRNETERRYDTDLEETIATERYEFITKVRRESITKKIIKESISDKLDRVFLNKWIAFPIFILIMFLVYYLSVGIIGSYTVDIVNNLINAVGEKVYGILTNIGTSDWIISLIVDGIIAGVGAVLGFIPQLIILFMCISLLETTGYMARIAVLLDRIFKRLGLSGKSLIPFIVGSGCSVPGIMGTRIIENQDEREMTIILTPFIPCSAKLPIIALFTGYFFKSNAGFVSASLYFFAIGIIILSAFLMKRLIFKKTSSTYISELPEYKIPSAKYIVKDVWDKVKAFIKRAGTTILVCSIVLWFLLSFSTNLEYGVSIKNSILAFIGNKISWIFYPILGKNSWEATVSAIQGLVAKEQVISSMSVISGLAETVENESQIFANDGIFGFFTASSAYAFMVFNLFSAPCIGAIGAMKRELGGTKKVLKAISFQTVLAWILATGVYQVGKRIEARLINYADIIIAFAIIFIVSVTLIKQRKENECSRCPYCNSCNKTDIIFSKNN